MPDGVTLGGGWVVDQWRLLKGPDLQAVDGEVLVGGEGLVVEGGAGRGGAMVEVRIQPQP